jgi:ATP-dependent Clp protease ATP-binding subunit ClpA
MRKGFHPKLGARPMRNAVEKLVGDAIAENLLAGKNSGRVITVNSISLCLERGKTNRIIMLLRD